MNLKERILEMDMQYSKHTGKNPIKDIEKISLTFIFKFQIFEPCKYISEDEEWVTFLLLPPDGVLESQIMSIRKEEIVSFGIFNENNVYEIEFNPKTESESLYQ